MMSSQDNDGNKRKEDTQLEHTKHSENCGCKGGSGNGTPPKFRFSAKFQVITHVKKFQNCQKELELFYEAMEPLQDKLLTLLIQFPPSLKIKEGLEALDKYDFYLDDTFRYAEEVRHSSWFSDLAYNFFKNNNICLVWNQ
ncbi:MAG: DUF72 domain-containing protein [Nitrososphaerota archaeon]